MTLPIKENEDFTFWEQEYKPVSLYQRFKKLIKRLWGK